MPTMSEQQRAESAKRLEQSRLDMGWTQEDLAAATLIGVRSISRWEQPHGSEPSPRSWKKLSEALGREIRYLRASDLKEERNGGDQRHDL